MIEKKVGLICTWKVFNSKSLGIIIVKLFRFEFFEHLQEILIVNRKNKAGHQYQNLKAYIQIQAQPCLLQFCIFFFVQSWHPHDHSRVQKVTGIVGRIENQVSAHTRTHIINREWCYGIIKHHLRLRLKLEPQNKHTMLFH